WSGMNLVIVKRNRVLAPATIEMEQREVPPVMKRETVVDGPVILARLEPVDSLLGASLHFHHMRDRVDCPCVFGLERESAAAGLFRFGVLIALFEPEGVHAENIGVAGNVGSPVWQHTRDARTKVSTITAEEVHEVSSLDRKRIARIVDEDVIE